MSSGEPLIQIVDKDDNPLRSATIKEAHENGLIHRIVRIVVENPSNGKILFQKRASTMHRWPGRWDNAAGGHVDEGEDYETAAKRELYEEIGIKPDDIEELHAYYSDDITPDGLVLKRFNKVYRVYNDSEKFNIDKGEVDEVRWMSADEIRRIAKDNPEMIVVGLMDIVNRYYS